MTTKTKIVWNKTTKTYTVSSASIIVRNIPVKSQANCVAMELRHNWTPSFGEIETR